MRTVNAFIASTLLLLVGCDEPPATVASSAIPKDCWGRYTGTQPAYEMRDKEGKVVEVNGNTITVPAIKNTLDINGEGIAWQQEKLEGDGRRTVDYDRTAPTTVENTKDRLVVECSFTANEGRSNPKRIFRLDLTNRTITMLGDRGSADCPLTRQ
jgi:hypothetical protein